MKRTPASGGESRAPRLRSGRTVSPNPGRARSGGRRTALPGLRPQALLTPWSRPPGPGLSGSAPRPAAPSLPPRQGRQGGADLPAKLRTAWEKPAPPFRCLQLV